MFRFSIGALMGGKAGDGVTWNKYKANIFDSMLVRQLADDVWATGYIGPVYSTAYTLTILQLDRASLPLYQK